MKRKNISILLVFSLVLSLLTGVSLDTKRAKAETTAISLDTEYTGTVSDSLSGVSVTQTYSFSVAAKGELTVEFQVTAFGGAYSGETPDFRYNIEDANGNSCANNNFNNYVQDLDVHRITVPVEAGEYTIKFSEGVLNGTMDVADYRFILSFTGSLAPTDAPKEYHLKNDEQSTITGTLKYDSDNWIALYFDEGTSIFFDDGFSGEEKVDKTYINLFNEYDNFSDYENYVNHRVTLKGTVVDYGKPAYSSSSCWLLDSPVLVEDLGSNEPETTETPSSSPSSGPITAEFERWGFTNTGSDNFYYDSADEYDSLGNRKRKKGYYISYADYRKLTSDLTDTERDRFFSDKESAYDVDGQTINYQEWDGSCYGMSASMFLVNSNLLNVTRGSNIRLQDIKIDSSIRSTINYYHHQQKLIWRDQTTAFHQYRQNEQIEDLVSLIKTEEGSRKKMALLGYKWFTWEIDENGEEKPQSHAHCVVAYDVEEGKYDKMDMVFDRRIRIWDPDCDYSNPEEKNGEDYDLYYNEFSANKSWCIPAYNIISTSTTVYDNNGDPYLHYYKSNNGIIDMISDEVKEIAPINQDGKFIGSHLNEENVAIESNNSSFSIESDLGTASIDGMIVKKSTYDKTPYIAPDYSSVDSNSVVKRIRYLIPCKKEMSIQGGSDGLSLWMSNNHRSNYVSTKSSGKVDLKSDGTITVNSNDNDDILIRHTTDYESEYADDCPTLEIVSKDAHSVSLEPTLSGCIISRDNLGDTEISTFNESEEKSSIKLYIGVQSVKVSNSNNGIVVSVDSNNDGSYDKVIAKSNPSKVKAKTPAKVKITKVTKKKAKKGKYNITVKWKKAKNASGYQVWLAKNKKFKKAKKYKTTKKKYTIKKLKKGKYYIRVRAYAKKGKKYKYGKYSKTKKA